MGHRPLAVAGSTVFLFIAPGTIAGLIPWWISRWDVQDPFLGWAGMRWCGALLICLGIAVILETFARFAWHGLGTPAPIFPTRRLVASGLYRYVRNPMYWGVVSTILGEGLLLGDVRVLIYGAFVWTSVHLFVLVYEEPTLRRSYGAEYEQFCAAVPRWLPRSHVLRSNGVLVILACAALACIYYLWAGQPTVSTSIAIGIVCVIVARLVMRSKLIPNPLGEDDRDFSMRPVLWGLLKGGVCILAAFVWGIACVLAVRYLLLPDTWLVEYGLMGVPFVFLILSGAWFIIGSGVKAVYGRPRTR